MSNLVIKKTKNQSSLIGKKFGNQKTDLAIIKWSVRIACLLITLLLQSLLFLAAIDELNNIREIGWKEVLIISLGLPFVVASIIGFKNEKIAGLILFFYSLFLVVTTIISSSSIDILFVLLCLTGFIGLFYLIIWRFSNFIQSHKIK